MRFFITNQQIHNDIVILSKDDGHHLINVLRAKIGDVVFVCDDFGTEYECHISCIEKQKVKLNVISSHHFTTELDCKIYLFQCVPKKEKFEFIIQKSIELGVHKIIPVFSKRCETKKSNFDSKNDRYNKIALSAAKQSRRGYVSEVVNSIGFNNAIDALKSLDLAFLCYENCQDKNLQLMLNALNIESKKKIGFIVGPEGGFEEKEVQIAKQNNIQICSLGYKIFRTETAPIYVLSVLNYLLDK